MLSKRILVLVITVMVLAVSCKKDGTSILNSIKPNDFLSSNKYTSLTVEIVYVNGFKPTTNTVNNLKTFLTQRLNKPEGITIIEREIASPGNSSYSISDIISVEKNNRQQQTEGDNLAVFFFFADSDFSGNSGNSKVLGVQYDPSSMAMFEKTIQEFSGGFNQPTKTVLETTVIKHEFGHTLGLVNNGTSIMSEHQDTPNGKHCDVDDCLMYFTAETSGDLGNLLGGDIPTLDSQCLADLKANGGK
ncbi:MAG: hypothetical protein ACJAZ3_000840 [Sphingobacteriales bacterium]|jgi:hypothetical protein